LQFWLPYYLPGDVLNYFNAWDIYVDRGIGNPMHAVRLGMILPLALLRWLSGDGHMWNAMYILAASLGTVYLSYHLACGWAGRAAGCLAGLTMALVPMEIVYGTVLLPDAPLSFLALASFACLVQAQQAKDKMQWQWVLAAGCLLGVAYTCKVTALFLLLPAVLQVFFLRRQLRLVVIFGAAVAWVIAVENLLLWFVLDDWYVRIYETLGFVSGSKGNYIEVDKTWGWWFGQIGFKLKALLAGGHVPTAVLLACIPHLVLLAIWRLRRKGWVTGAAWVLAWGGIWVAQQLFISSIEQEPRYFQVALPYAAIAIGLAFGDLGEKWQPRRRYAVVAGATVWAIVGAGLFWSTFSPTASATKALLLRYDQLHANGEKHRVGGPSEFVLRLAHYRGLQTELNGSGEDGATHWAQLSNGYSRVVDGQVAPPEYMNLEFVQEFHSPLESLFHVLGIAPGVGLVSEARLYRGASVPLAAVKP
jgi:hypothetical protein